MGLPLGDYRCISATLLVALVCGMCIVLGRVFSSNLLLNLVIIGMCVKIPQTVSDCLAQRPARTHERRIPPGMSIVRASYTVIGSIYARAHRWARGAYLSINSE